MDKVQNSSVKRFISNEYKRNEIRKASIASKYEQVWTARWCYKSIRNEYLSTVELKEKKSVKAERINSHCDCQHSLNIQYIFLFHDTVKVTRWMVKLQLKLIEFGLLKCMKLNWIWNSIIDIKWPLSILAMRAGYRQFFVPEWLGVIRTATNKRTEWHDMSCAFLTPEFV